MSMMNAGITFDCGDILLIPLPFSDLSAEKQRPVIVVTPKRYLEESHGDFIAIAITSNPMERPYSVELLTRHIKRTFILHRRFWGA